MNNQNLKPVWNMTRADVEAIQDMRAFVRVRLQGFDVVERAYLAPIMRQLSSTLDKLERAL